MFKKKLETKGIGDLIAKQRTDAFSPKPVANNSAKQSEVNKNQQTNKEVSSKKPENLKNTNN